MSACIPDSVMSPPYAYCQEIILEKFKSKMHYFQFHDSKYENSFDTK